MAELIPPRRDETLTADGVPSLRFSEYLEGLSRGVNSNTQNNEVVSSVASASPAQLANVLKQLADLELQTDNTALLARIFKRLNDLEATQVTSDAVGVNTAIESTFDRRYALLVG